MLVIAPVAIDHSLATFRSGLSSISWTNECAATLDVGQYKVDRYSFRVVRNFKRRCHENLGERGANTGWHHDTSCDRGPPPSGCGGGRFSGW
jgi:hypothetical protein